MLRLHVGVVLPGLGEQLGHEPPAGGADHADADGADHLVAQCGDVGDHGVELGHDPPGAPGHHLALLGEQPEERSTRLVCNSRSSRAIWAEMFDWTVPRAWAAREKLPESAMARSACRCRSSITNDDSKYHWELLDRFVAVPAEWRAGRKDMEPPSFLRFK